MLWYWCSPTAHNLTSLRCNYVKSYFKNYKRAQWELCSLRFVHHNFPKNGNSSPEVVERKKYTSKKNSGLQLGRLASQSQCLFSPLFYPNRKSSWLVKGCILTFNNPHHVLNSGTASNSWVKKKMFIIEERFFAEVSSSAPVKVSSDIYIKKKKKAFK